MAKEIIEKYIQFAIDNGLDLHKWVSERENFDKWTKDFRISVNFKGFSLISNINNDFLHGVNLFEFITSKEFIEAVARGLVKKLKGKSIEGLFGYGAWVFGDNIDDFNQELEEITINQAIAIRDGKLEEFIKNLLPKE